ncbi:hypothetical protein HBO12_23985 [Pseudomonas sp. WS 5059]|uniref:hypothetical protein n=1 Tax=unclassified Pseudomonas TaxID=196821 RepID=UPI001475C9A5|nr:hypothetical protein [Pseudomonas sp. WS 5059]NMY06030.1 hypothetical protein [Pseudomonas sp. WS 5059]
MKTLSINALLPCMLEEFSTLALNPKAVPTEEQAERLKTLQRGAENSALAAELGVSAIGAALGICADELGEVHICNLGWLLELLGDLSGTARHIEHEAIYYLRRETVLQ